MNFTDPAPKAIVEQTIHSLQQKGYMVHHVSSEAEALSYIKENIPPGASVMHGSSITLEQIGYLSFLAKGSHEWRDLHAMITNEHDNKTRAALRRESTTADYYLGSVHAVTESGDILVASNTGSQLPHLTFTSPNIILVIGTQKIVPSISAAVKRLEEYVLPLESERSSKAYGAPSQINKILIIKGENPMLQRRVHIILVDKTLGF